MVWDMGSYERYCVGCIGWIWAGGVWDVMGGFCVEISGGFVWFCICDLNDVLYDFIGWF